MMPEMQHRIFFAETPTFFFNLFELSSFIMLASFWPSFFLSLFQTCNHLLIRWSEAVLLASYPGDCAWGPPLNLQVRAQTVSFNLTDVLSLTINRLNSLSSLSFFLSFFLSFSLSLSLSLSPHSVNCDKTDTRTARQFLTLIRRYCSTHRLFSPKQKRHLLLLTSIGIIAGVGSIRNSNR